MRKTANQTNKQKYNSGQLRSFLSSGSKCREHPEGDQKHFSTPFSGESVLGISNVSAEKHKPYLQPLDYIHYPVRDDRGSAILPLFLIVWGKDLQNSPFFWLGNCNKVNW